MEYLLILFSTATSLLEGTFIKKYNSKHTKGGFFFTGLVSLFSMLFFFITDKGGLTFTSEVILYGLISGFLYCSASIFTFIALGCGSFAMSMLILSYSGVFSIAYGLLFLKEQIGVFTYIGLALIMLSLFLFRGPSDKTDNQAPLSAKWLVFISVSVIASGLYSVIQKIQQIKFDNLKTNEFMIVTLGFSAITLFIIGITRDGKDTVYIIKHGGIWASCAGISNGITNMLSLILNTMLPFSIVSPIRSGTKMLFSFLLSLILFKEKFLKRQIIGVIVGTVALIFLNLKI